MVVASGLVFVVFFLMGYFELKRDQVQNDGGLDSCTRLSLEGAGSLPWEWVGGMECWDGILGGCIAQCRIPQSFTSPVVQAGEEGGERDENREVNPTMWREERAEQGPGLGAVAPGAWGSQRALGSISCSDMGLHLDTRHGTTGHAHF